MTEAELLRAYAVTPATGSRTEHCACGGWIVAIDGDPENVAANVRIHNLTEEHQEWRQRRCACWGE